MVSETSQTKLDNRSWLQLWPVLWDPAVTQEAVDALFLDTLIRTPQTGIDGNKEIRAKQISELQSGLAGSDCLVFSREPKPNKGEVLFEAKNKIGKALFEGSLEAVLDVVDGHDPNRQEYIIYPVMNNEGFPAKVTGNKSKKKTAVPSAAAVDAFNSYEHPETLVTTLFSQFAAEARTQLLVKSMGIDTFYEQSTGTRVDPKGKPSVTMTDVGRGRKVDRKMPSD